MSFSKPVEKICEELKKKDAQICELRYGRFLYEFLGNETSFLYSFLSLNYKSLRKKYPVIDSTSHGERVTCFFTPDPSNLLFYGLFPLVTVT